MFARLIRLIEDHWDPLTDRIIRRMREDARVRHLGSLPETDLRGRARDILQHLGDWLPAGRERDIADRFERLGMRRRDEGVPLEELVLSYIIIKDTVIDYVRSQGIASSVELWAEEELEHSLGTFFDSLVYHLVRGYMAAARTATAAR